MFYLLDIVTQRHVTVLFSSKPLLEARCRPFTGAGQGVYGVLRVLAGMVGPGRVWVQGVQYGMVWVQGVQYGMGA